MSMTAPGEPIFLGNEFGKIEPTFKVIRIADFRRRAPRRPKNDFGVPDGYIGRSPSQFARVVLTRRGGTGCGFPSPWGPHSSYETASLSRPWSPLGCPYWPWWTLDDVRARSHGALVSQGGSYNPACHKLPRFAMGCHGLPRVAMGCHGLCIGALGPIGPFGPLGPLCPLASRGSPGLPLDPWPV